MSSPYLFVFAQAHDDFRIPELLSVSELHGFTITMTDAAKDCDSTRPFMILELEKEEHARILARRCILVRSVYHFYAKGSTYEELHERNRDAISQWSPYIPDTSFKYSVNAYNHKISQSCQKEIIESFSYMELLGRIDMKNPEVTFGYFEEYEDIRSIPKDQRNERPRLLQVYFGRLVEEGSARQLVKKFDVKKREYFGNTSMEAEISLLMANQTLACPGKIVYDPFVGTGSMAYTTAHFGAQVFGSDIDGRQMRGKSKSPGIIRAASQYGVAHRILDLCTFDVTRNPWRCGELFDAIVTDPPYGVRAGAKRLGRKKERPIDQQLVSQRSVDLPYIPPTKPYELSDLASDLVILSRYLLKPGGRLVFFLPTVTGEYDQVDIDSMLCEGMEVIANSLQDFGSWGRRLVTIRKTTMTTYPMPSFNTDSSPAESIRAAHIPAHKDFREKYFQGFRKDNDSEGQFDSPNRDHNGENSGAI